MEFLFVLPLIVAAIFYFSLSIRGKGEETPYTKNNALFTPAERSFLGVLEDAIGEEYRIYGKVRIADIVSVKPMADRSKRMRAFNQISAKHVDFLLCDKADLSIVAAIELDDSSHRRRSRQARDTFLVDLCKSVSLPLIRVPAKKGYVVGEVRASILAALGVTQAALQITPTAPQVPAQPPIPVAAPESQEKAKGNQPEKAPATAGAATAAPQCPKCAKPMVRRKRRARGEQPAEEFWGCSSYPKCRSILPLEELTAEV